MIGKFKIETPKKILIDEFVCLRSKMYAFKCGDDSKNLKGISQTYAKDNKFGENKKCLDGQEYQQECDNYLIRSLNHKRYLQRVRKSTLSQFDDKRCYINETKNDLWKTYS